MGLLTGKTALVTGAARGIGKRDKRKRTMEEKR
jgi:short-subunit dehydrogenase